MKKTLYLIILLLAANHFKAFTQIYTSEIKYTYDKNNRLTGYEFDEVFTGRYFYDESSNRTGQNSLVQTPVQEITDNKDDIIVFPNPFNGDMFMVNLQSGYEISSMILLDNTGRMLPVKWNKTGSPVTVYVPELLPGIYVLRLNTEETTKTIIISKTEK